MPARCCTIGDMSLNPFKNQDTPRSLASASTPAFTTTRDNNFNSKKGRSAFSVKQSAFKTSSSKPKPVVETFDVTKADFPSLVATPVVGQKDSIDFKSLFIQEQPVAVKHRDIPPGWIQIDKRTRTITKNKQDQDYDDYLERRDRIRSDETPPSTPPPTARQCKNRDLRCMLDELDYNVMCEKLDNICEQRRHEDVLRECPVDVDVVQSWDLKNYLEQLEFEKKWNALNEEDDSCEEDDTSEGSDLEYM